MAVRVVDHKAQGPTPGGRAASPRRPRKAPSRVPRINGPLSPADLLALQRTVGNTAVGILLQRHMAAQRDSASATSTPVQRDAAAPATLDEALRTDDADNLEAFRPFTGITDNQLLSLVNLITTKFFVTPTNERILEEAWRSYGRKDSLRESDFALWESCARRGAKILNVPWLYELQTQFGTEVRELARRNLERNTEAIDAEARRLGIQPGGDNAGPATPEQDAAIRDQQVQAARIRDAKDVMRKLTALEVGYLDPKRAALGNASLPGGIVTEEQDRQMAAERRRALFSPTGRPPYDADPADGMPSWDAISATYQQLTRSIAAIINRNPALYALVSTDSMDATGDGGTDAVAAPDRSPQQIRATLGTALGGVMTEIGRTRTAIDNKSLGFEQMFPVHEKLYEQHKVYTTPFAKAAAQGYVKERGGDAAAGGEVVTIATIALILAVEIATAWAATPVIGALIGLTASATTAADSWQNWSTLDSAARSTVSDTNAVVRPAQAEEALLTAAVDTALALLDVYQLGKSARTAAGAAKVAGLEARFAARRQFAALAGDPLKRKAFVVELVEREGAQAAVAASGRTVDELLALVGRETPAGKRLSILATGLGAAEELGTSLTRLGQLGGAEAATVIGRSIEVFGPGQTLGRAGGWDKVAHALRDDAAGLARLENWRSALLDQAGAILPEGAEAATAMRGYLAERTGIGADAVETLLGVAISSLRPEEGQSGALEVEGGYVPIELDLDRAANSLAQQRGIDPTQVQRQMVVPASNVLPMTERQLDRLSPEEFEEAIRMAIRSGHFAPEGLPRMSVVELKNSSGHGLDGIGIRRNGDRVNLYKFEMKQTSVVSEFGPRLPSTAAGVEGGKGWAFAKAEMLFQSSDPAVFESWDVLRGKLQRLFGNRYSDHLLMEAFQHELQRAPLTTFVRLNARLDSLLPSLRGLARWYGKGSVKVIVVRGR